VRGFPTAKLLVIFDPKNTEDSNLFIESLHYFCDIMRR